MLDEASEFFKEIRLAITERLTSPLIGAYWISWVIFNFKFILIIFSGENLDKKLSLIHESFFSDTVAYAITYGAPVAMTAVFIFVYPYPAEFVYKFRLQFQRRLVQIKQKIEDEQLLSTEDSRKLRLEIREKEQAFVTRLAEAEQQIDDLRRVNESLRSKTTNVTPPTSPVTQVKVDKDDVSQPVKRGKGPRKFEPIGDLTLTETAVMRALASLSPNGMFESDVIAFVRRDDPSVGNVNARVSVKEALSSLTNSRKFLGYSNNVYMLTKAGEKFAAENNL